MYLYDHPSGDKEVGGGGEAKDAKRLLRAPKMFPKFRMMSKRFEQSIMYWNACKTHVSAFSSTEMPVAIDTASKTHVPFFMYKP